VTFLTCFPGVGGQVAPCPGHVEAVIHIAEFPATISPLLGEITMDEFHIFAEKLMSDALFLFAKTNFDMTSARKRRSLSQELLGVAPWPRRIILSSKSETRGVIGRITVNPIEQHLGESWASLGFSRKSWSFLCRCAKPPMSLSKERMR
jgi:hypothetical protein